MAIDETTRELISIKKLSGKAHTSNDKGLPNEGKPSGLTLSSETVFGEAIPATPTKTLYTITGGTVEYLRLSASFVQGSDTATGRHGFELLLPDDYESASSNPLKGSYPFTNGQSVQVTSGSLQLVPTSFGTNYEAKPYHSASSVQTQIPVLDARDWYLDYFNGIFFQQDPPGTGDNASNPRYVDAFLYIGDFLNKVVATTGGGDPGAQYIVIAATGSLSRERVLNAGSGLSITDGGAGSNVTIGLDNDIVATISGSTFSGAVTAPALSGSLTKLSGGTSYLVAGTGIAITSASNGQVTITGNVGDVTAVNVSSGLTGGGNSGAVTIGINDDILATVSGTTFSGAVKHTLGLSGSLTKLVDGTSYLVAGSNVTIASSSNGQVTVASTDTNTTYTAGNGLDLTGNAFSVDLKSGGGLEIDSTELAINDNVVATVSGTTFSGAVKFSSGLSGSLTNLTNGTSYLVAGNNITITSASNGQVTIVGSGAGTIDGSGVATRLAYWSDSDTITGDADLTFDGDTLTAANSSNTAIPAITIDRNYTGTTDVGNFTTDPAGLLIDYDVTGIVASGQTTVHDAIAVNYNQDAPTHVGTVLATGADIRMTGGTSGTQSMKGVAIVLAGADTNTGIDITVPNDGTHIIARSPDNILDHFKLSVGASGATTLSTSDQGASVGNLTLDADGKIIIEAVAGDEVVFNEGSADVDFRVESNSNAHMLFVDGGTEKIGIGTASPTHTLSIVGAVSASLGLSGSLTRLVDGTSYLKAGSNVTITSASNGAVTIASADTNTTYTAGTGLNLGGSEFTVDSSTVALRAGTTFSGDVDFQSDIRVSGTLHVYELKTTLVSSSIIFKSGSTKFGDTSDDIHAFTGSAAFVSGLSGSLTHLAGGTSYLIAGSNVQIVTGSSGAVTISSTDTNTTYSSSDFTHDDLSGFVAAEHIDWTADQGGTNLHAGNYTDTNTTYSAGDGLDLGGTTFALDLKTAGGLKIDSTELSLDDNIVATVSGSTFTGAVKFNSGLSGSLTHLHDGTSYLLAGDNITITTSSAGAVTVAASGGEITVTSGSTSVGSISTVNFTNAALVQNLGSGQVALTGTIGTAEDGDYTDGLYTDFTAKTTVGTAVDRFNEVLKALAPTPAPALDDVDVNSDGTDVELSFGASNDQSSGSPAYVSVAASAGIGAAVNVNGTYETATASNNLRAAVFDGTTNIIGELNEDVAQNVHAGNNRENYPVDSFGDAEDGLLQLWINGAKSHEIDLGGNGIGTGGSGNGSGTHVNGNGSGFVTLSAATTGTFENGGSFASFKHRTGQYKVHTADQRRGWNYVRVLHVRSGSTQTTNYVEWVNDDNSDALSAAGNGITFTGIGSVNLSGVTYYRSGTVSYVTRVTNAYKYVYDTTAVSFTRSFGGTNSNAALTLASQAKPTINTGAGEDHTKTLHMTASNTLTADYMIGGSVLANVTVTHPLKSDLTSGGASTVSNILSYNLSDTSTGLSETFQSETYRMQSGSYDNQAAITGGSSDWDSTKHMSGTNTGHDDGLLVYIGRLYKPVAGGNSGNFIYANGPSPSNPNYSGISDGLRTYYRKFQNTTGRAVNNLSWATAGSGATLVAEDTAVAGNARVRVFFKHPTSTEWLDAFTAFSYNAVTNREGGAAPSGGAGDTSLASATNYASFGTGSIGNNEWVMMKIEADDDWTGYLDTVTVVFGSEGTIAPAPNLSQIDCNNSGVDGSLSFGSSLALAGYSNVTNNAGHGVVNVNADYDLSGNRRGILDGDTDAAGDLNEQVSASGNNYSANSFGGGSAHTGSLKLEVNGSVIHTFDLNNNFAANSDTSGASGSGFNLSAAIVSRDSNEIPEWERWYRTGTWTVKAANQRKGHNYTRVSHVVTGTTLNSTYAEWVNDTDGADATVTVLTGTTSHPGGFVNFRGTGATPTYYKSGIGYFVSPKADFVVTGSNIYKYVYSENAAAISFPTTTNCSVASTHVSGSGVVNGSVAATTMALPNLNTGVSDAPNHAIFVTGTVSFGQSTSIPGGTSYTMAGSCRINHPIHGNTTSNTQTSQTLLVFSGTDNSTDLIEYFNGEVKRLISGSYGTQASVVAGGNKWDSTVSMNGADAGHNEGLAVYDSKLLAPANTGNSGDFRSAGDGGSLAAPSGNPNYSNVTNSERHYTRWFKNTSGGSKTDFAITVNGTGTIVAAGTSLASSNKIRVHAKIPRTVSAFETGWMDLATAFSTGEIGDDAGCLVGSLDSSLNASNDATFGTQSVGADEYILVRIIAAKSWTGNITDITISWS